MMVDELNSTAVQRVTYVVLQINISWFASSPLFHSFLMLPIFIGLPPYRGSMSMKHWGCPEATRGNHLGEWRVQACGFAFTYRFACIHVHVWGMLGFILVCLRVRQARNWSGICLHWLLGSPDQSWYFILGFHMSCFVCCSPCFLWPLGVCGSPSQQCFSTPSIIFRPKPKSYSCRETRTVEQIVSAHPTMRCALNTCNIWCYSEM